MSTIPLGTINGIPSTNTASPYYLPPKGYYQNDAGAIIPNSAVNTPGASSSAASSTPWYTSALNAIKGYETAKGATVNRGLEDYVFIVLGLIVIIAGVFGLEGTRSIIVNTGKAAAKAGELAA